MHEIVRLECYPPARHLHESKAQIDTALRKMDKAVLLYDVKNDIYDLTYIGRGGRARIITYFSGFVN
ncbi:hypothetical protein [Mucilaginibacter sp.]|uniref:hypothetical protein n=1 Tax=Mucilaginibacter sp. TaxID=1882438 RepID=UPI00284125B6|nr:hypothetical protein [Mucilaginibacter sp.]MDR3693222.1 hypothetical protein [Mucilaginibacter sp.]